MSFNQTLSQTGVSSKKPWVNYTGNSLQVNAFQLVGVGVTGEVLTAIDGVGNAQWQAPSAVPGPTGAEGPTGPTGAAGHVGPAGPTGPTLSNDDCYIIGDSSVIAVDATPNITYLPTLSATISYSPSGNWSLVTYMTKPALLSNADGTYILNVSTNIEHLSGTGGVYVQYHVYIDGVDSGTLNVIQNVTAGMIQLFALQTVVILTAGQHLQIGLSTNSAGSDYQLDGSLCPNCLITLQRIA